MSISSISPSVALPIAPASVSKPQSSAAQPASKPVAAPTASAPADSDGDHDGSSGSRISVRA